MSARPTILFVCNELNYNLFNRRSAIDSILCSILLELNKQYNILVNGDPIAGLMNASSDEPAPGSPFRKAVVQMMPTGVKESIKMGKLLANSSGTIDYIKSKSIKPDLVLELYKLGSNIGLELSKTYGCPYLIYYDSPVVEQYEDVWRRTVPKKSEVQGRQQASLKHASDIIVYSEPVAKAIAEMGADGKKHIFQTLDYTRLQLGEHRQGTGVRIGFIGSFMPWHRVDILVRSFFKIREAGHQDVTLALIGSGEKVAEIRTIVENSPHAQHVEMPGFVDGDELERYKSGLDIGVMSGSNWYGMPTKVFEYGAYGIAALAPNTPTIGDIFAGGENISLFKWDDQDDFHQRLSQLIEDPDLRTRLGAQLKRKIQTDHTLERAVDFYNELIQKMLAATPA